MTAQDIVERIMTLHWDLAACKCPVCVAGHELGFGARDRWLRDPELEAWDLNFGETKAEMKKRIGAR